MCATLAEIRLVNDVIDKKLENRGGKINITIDQSHRYGRHRAACREPAGSYDKSTRTAIPFWT